MLGYVDVRRILVEREMCASPVIVEEVAGQDAAQVAFAENENMVQTLAPNRTDEALCEGILPRAVRRRENLLDAHTFHAAPKRLTVDAVAVAEEIRWRGVLREGVHDLLGGPGGGGVLGDVEVDDAAAVGERGRRGTFARSERARDDA